MVCLSLVVLLACACHRTNQPSTTVVPTAVDNQPPSAGKRFLLLHSYHAEYPWVASITKGVKEALLNRPVQLDIFYMDTKRHTSDQWKQRMAKEAMANIDRLKPDAVIVADDNALQLVARHYSGKTPFFVFCGINGEPQEFGLPSSNVTGIIERPHFLQSLAYLREFKPQAQKLVFLSDDGPTSQGALAHLNQLPLGATLLEKRLTGSFAQWKQTVLNANQTADALFIYMYHTIKQEGVDESLDPQVVMQWTREHATIPTVGFFEFSIADGMLLGVVESGQEHGREATRIALELTAGQPIGQFGIETAKEGLRLLNIKTAGQLSLPTENVNCLSDTFCFEE